VQSLSAQSSREGGERVLEDTKWRRGESSRSGDVAAEHGIEHGEVEEQRGGGGGGHFSKSQTVKNFLTASMHSAQVEALSKFLS
jgi:hypothetical protein